MYVQLTQNAFLFSLVFSMGTVSSVKEGNIHLTALRSFMAHKVKISCKILIHWHIVSVKACLYFGFVAVYLIVCTSHTFNSFFFVSFYSLMTYALKFS